MFGEVFQYRCEMFDFEHLWSHFIVPADEWHFGVSRRLHETLYFATEMSALRDSDLSGQPWDLFVFRVGTFLIWQRRGEVE